MVAPTQPPLTKNWRHFIPGQPSIITEASWLVRNRLWDRHFAHAMDLMAFPEPHIVDILIDVEQDEKPAKEFPVGPPDSPRPLAWLPNRSYLEWHLFRGVNPRGRRPGISPALRALVIERDGYTCGICLGDVEPGDVHLDHIQPLSKGGPTTLANLRVTHSRCNMSKGARV